MEIIRVKRSGLEVVQLVHRQEKLPGDLVYQSGNWYTRSPGNVTGTSPGNAQSPPHAGFAVQGSGVRVKKESLLYQQPIGPKSLYHRNDLVDRPRAMGV